MRFFVLFFILVSQSVNAFTVKDNQKAPARLSSVKRIITSYKQAELDKTLREFLSKSKPSRFVGTHGHANAKAYIIDHIKKGQGSGELLVVDEFAPPVAYAVAKLQNDFKETFKDSPSKGDKSYLLWQSFTNSMISTLRENQAVVGNNIIWEKKGTVAPNKVLMVGVNYDTIVIDKKKYVINSKAEMPGADNNASGVAVALSMIEILQELNLPMTVRIVFFDYEDLGMLGSYSYVKKYLSGLERTEQIVGFINLRMLGHDTKINDRTKRKGNMSLYIRKSGEQGSDLDELLAKRFVLRGKKVASSVQFAIDPNGNNSSSHANFWTVGIPSMLFTHNMEHDSNELRNRTPNDFIETLNLRTLYNGFKYISAGVIGEAFGISK